MVSLDISEFDPADLKKLYKPPKDSHKGENGKLLIVAGSGLFHAPAVWSAEIASRIVDMVYVASTPSNNGILQNIKGKFWDGIVVPRESLADYTAEADCILIGPGLPRPEGQQGGEEDSRELTRYVLTEFVSEKRVVIDGGALQVMEPELIPKGAILTPHRKEWERLLKKARENSVPFLKDTKYPCALPEFAKYFNCIVLLKCGKVDYICSPNECRVVKGGNAGMTKGGTGDVLAGLVAALACKNDPFLAAAAGSYINKAAGDSLFERVGYTYNSSDLLREIPLVMKKIVS